MTPTPSNATLLKVSISASFTLIPGRVSMGFPKISAAQIDTTDLDSTWDTIILSSINRSEPFEITINWDPANAVHAYLWTAITTKTLESFKFTFADTGAADKTFSGYVVSDALQDVTVDGVVQKKIGIKPSGTVTLTP